MAEALQRPTENSLTRYLLIVDDLGTVQYTIEGLLSRHADVKSGRLAITADQVTDPDDIPAAVERARETGTTYDLALVDLDFGARRVGGSQSHGLTALRLLSQHTPDTKIALYTADVEGNRELMLRAAFELFPLQQPQTWISKASPADGQAEMICALLEGRDVPMGHLRPYLTRPEHLRLRSVCGTRTQLRIWQALALGLDSRTQIARQAGVSPSTLDKFVANVREFILDCMPPLVPPEGAQAPGSNGRSANLALAVRFAYANRAFFSDPELERLVSR
ncbi:MULTISPECIES: response regulator transcription factor [Thermomonospora]|uniref:Response regulator receiver protein n=1 Tax=Thermomonospora curvata (strain ATCC 19995 / DSM 43183 / JCM 3096 / KCTC 9072 / NBRC 15933 / NCIMB 10081 / Henssen B9) TaxID=471852 RepID=D1AAK7_THECD|nr:MULTISPECIES: response regulator transcription factor [Thermomonospora]ACY97017.1 response regulator receiver protein [Thermomonospora curvata DSM 43183]PKK14901.1 MAG: DNA-binding response regulator [Thermomonospora sp. CIF 1]